MKQKLDKFFKPKSIAVIGASKNTTKIGHAALKNILISDIFSFPIMNARYIQSTQKKKKYWE
jgi:predicted CoA-binding protein